MPSETPPTTPDQEPKTPPINPEADPNKEPTKESAPKTADYFGPDNKGIFDKMSENGKNIANYVYEGLYKIPGVNRIVGKLEIAYNQFWADKHETKAVELKSKMEGLDIGRNALDQSKKEIESVIENLKQQNIPGVESLQLKLKDIDQQNAKLLGERDTVQSRFEARENKVKLYTNERDRVANKLIEHYNENLRPIEQELEGLETCRDQTELQIAVTEVQHKEQAVKLADMEKSKAQIEGALKKAGVPENKIKKFEAVRVLEKLLTAGREKTKKEKEALVKRKAEINEQIAALDAKANPYRDKKQEFIRVKENRPLKINVEARKREEGFKREEEIKAHARTEQPKTPEIKAKEKPARTSRETAEESKEYIEISSYVSSYNKFLKEKYGRDVARELIDLKDFAKETRLPADYKLEFRDFKNILEKYYKLKKAPLEKFNKRVNEFYEERVKSKK